MGCFKIAWATWVCGFVATAVSAQAQPIIRDGVTLDKGGAIDRELLKAALASFDEHGAAITNRHRIAVVDLARHSRFPRFHVLNLKDGSVRSVVTTHGEGSDPNRTGRAVRASNRPGSEASSVGAFIAREIYLSDKHKSRALRLDGVDATNSNARCRCIVMHAATHKSGQNYASASWVKVNGTAGRSHGCFAFANEDMGYVFGRMTPGTLIYAGPTHLANYAPVDKKCDCGGEPKP